MKAVILAAGRGSRLAPITDDIPKGLIELGGETILHRELRLLAEHHIDSAEIHIVTGYRSEKIEQIWPNVIYNELWNAKENSYSVLLALEKLGVDDFLFLDSDLLFDGLLLDKMLDCAYPNVLSCMHSDDSFESTGIEVDECGFATRIGKQVRGSGLVYTSLFRIGVEAYTSYIEALSEPRNQSTWYTGAMNEMFVSSRFYALASEAAWMEIDDPDDLIRARAALKDGVIA